MNSIRRTAKRLALTGALLTVLAPPIRAQQPSAGGDTLEITSQRIDQLLKGLKGEQPLREKLAKETGAVGQHQGGLTEKEAAKMEECGKADMERYQAQAQADPNYDPKKAAQMDKDNKKKVAKEGKEWSKEYMKRMQQIARSGDGAALQRYQDSVRRASTQRSAQLRAQRSGPACGTLEASASPAQLAQVDAAGAEASGIALPQYVTLRSRVGTYFRTGAAGGEGVTYTKAEQKVFEKRGRDLMPYGMMLGSSSP
jgi:hypothetical protein